MKEHPRKDGRRSGKRDSLPDREEWRQPRFSRKLFVLYEDDAVVVLDKPAGLLSVPVRGSDTPSALSLLSAEMKLKRQRPFIVHRIDRFTSGILLFAKTESDRDTLVRQFLGILQSGSISRWFAGVSPPRKGGSFTTFDVKGCFKYCAWRATPKRPVPSFDIPSSGRFWALHW